MNYSTAVFLINDKVRAIAVTYEAGETAPRTIFKTFDQSIKKDDYVLVPTDTRHKMTVCKVMGLTLRAKLGRERMEREGWALLPSSSALPADPHHSPKRLPVVWSSSNDNNQDQYGATLDAVRGEMAHV